MHRWFRDDVDAWRGARKAVRMRRLLLLLVCALALPSSAMAFSFSEVGDAGQLLGTAQTPLGVGSLDTIEGILDSQNDVDLYLIEIVATGLFSVSVSATLSGDNDAQLFLFDSAGFLVFADDDDGPALLPQITAGELAFASVGVYYLAFSLFNSDPSSDPLAGWTLSPAPSQSGGYTLNLTGTVAVPEPRTGLLLGLGLLGLGVHRHYPIRT